VSPAVDRRPLTRDRVVRAALELIDEAGLEALSMRKLGAALGVEAMSLYNHVSSKDDLLNGVADLLLELVELPRAPAATWDVQLAELCRAVRRMGLAHPRAFPLLVTQPHSSFESWAPILTGFDLVAGAGLSDDDAVQAVNAVAAFLVGFLLFEINAEKRRSRDSACHAVPDNAASPLLCRFVGARHPTDAAEEFAQGLELLVRGIAASIECSAAGQEDPRP
jgi:TetR/AcrR family transcriptional regulator, tetracycline repressor protein